MRLVRAEGLAKAFGATRAVRSFTFDLDPGEVHAIIGENGSGKSTVVKMLAGIVQPDAGELELRGRPVGSVASPRAALAHGIGTVFQEVLVVPPRSVYENVWLGVDGFFRESVPANEKRARAQALLTELLERPPDLGRPVSALSLSDRQACAIVRTLAREPAILILDEATSALDIATRERLFGVLRRLVSAGTGVIFISHRMDEVGEIGDRITVMRSGENVATVSRGEVSPRELVRLMTGVEKLTPAVDVGRSAVGAVVLRADGLQLAPRARPFDVEVRAGELVGVAGLEGHGQEAFLHALRGAGSFAGEVVASPGVVLGSPRQARRLGIVYVPRERRADATFEPLSIRENFALPTLWRDAVGRLAVTPRRSQRRFHPFVAKLGIRLRSVRDHMDTLSGGNQQKVVIARWLAADPKVLLLNDPTRGVDIGAKRDIYRLLVGLAGEGIAVVMLSSEVDEHVELMDRVLVFREAALAAELRREALDRQALVSAFFGERVDADEQDRARV
ncbi:MAG TPA: sugar ABC transporter ATP-binding protein [Gaiellaceae bacterium]|nr:sugar ABC transporter ATP-binding protein [Gaiellaceae bacterium]